MKAEFDSMPPAVVREGNILRLFFGFEEVEKDGQDGQKTTKFVGNNVNVQGDHSYGSLVSAMIKDVYPDDVLDAICANYELVRDNPEHEKYSKYVAEYEAFQQYRAYAKNQAQSIVNELITQ